MSTREALIEEFEKEFPLSESNYGSTGLHERIKNIILKAFEAGEQAERERLLSALKAGQLCTSCGGENTEALSDTCADCLENE